VRSLPDGCDRPALTFSEQLSFDRAERRHKRRDLSLSTLVSEVVDGPIAPLDQTDLSSRRDGSSNPGISAALFPIGEFRSAHRLQQRSIGPGQFMVRRRDCNPQFALGASLSQLDERRYDPHSLLRARQCRCRLREGGQVSSHASVIRASKRANNGPKGPTKKKSRAIAPGSCTEEDIC
jgi:hypothetical protein